MKLDILFHYDVNELTGEIKFVGKEEIKIDTAIKDAVKQTDNGIPKVILSPNKLTLSISAIALLKAQYGTKIDIKYHTKDGVTMPVIGTEQSFGTSTGNKLTKSNTISFRGNCNDTLAEYGNEFTLEPFKDGTYYLLGNKTKESVPEEILDIEQELKDLDLLDDLSIEEDENELDKFNFTI